MRRQLLAVPFLIWLTACSYGTWYQRGPGASPSTIYVPGGLSGRLTAIAVMPNDPERIMVGSPGGGIWVRDASGTWRRPLHYGMGDFTILGLQWDRSVPGRLFAVTPSDLYATTDFGEHWTNLTGNGGMPAPLNQSPPVTDEIPFVQFPLAGGGNALLWAPPCSGLWYSLDDGATFTQGYPFAGGTSNIDNCVRALAVDESDGRIYMSTNGGGFSGGDQPHLFRSHCLWTSTTTCLDFDMAHGGWPTQLMVDALVWTGTPGSVAAATMLAGGDFVDYVTSDSGMSWSRPGATPSVAHGGGPASAFVRAPNGQLFLAGGGANETHDLGANWNPFYDTGPSSLIQPHPDIRAFAWYLPSAGGAGYVWSTSDGSSAENSHAAITRFHWTPGSTPSNGQAVSHQGITSSTLYSVEPAARTGAPPRLFAGAHDNGATCSDDRGVTWSSAGAPQGNNPEGTFCGDIYSVVVAPSNPNRAYSRNCDPGSFQRSDNASSASTCADVHWTPVSLRTGAPGAVDGAGIYSQIDVNSVIAVDPTNADRVVFANYQFVAISVDGATFHNSAALPVATVVICVAIDSSHAIYAGTLGHGVYVSTDSGVSWIPFALNTASPMFVMKVLPVPGGTFFLATNRGLFRRRAGEMVWQNVTTWSEQSPDVAYAVSDVVVDPRCSSIVYAAFGWVGIFGHHRGGVIASTDGGTTWTSISSGFDIHQGPVTYLKVDPTDSRYLYVGTWGQGAWVYDLGETPPACP
jgi:hypothetical protein